MELELSDQAQILLHHMKSNKFNQADERCLYGGGNPDAIDAEGVVDAAVSELRAAGLDLRVSNGGSRRVIAIVTGKDYPPCQHSQGLPCFMCGVAE